ncbi:MAG: DarT ssDNA thymidine ADP-ribosyltransferase family protein [Bacillota bacterium]
MTYSEIIKNNCEIADVAWWPKFAYHYTDITNAVNILSTGYIYSRLQVSDKQLMKNDNASMQVINMTESEALSSARFYFRPMTPTQYYNEGYKHPDLRYDGDRNANVTVPIFFLFDMEKILKTNGVAFSEFSQAGHGAELYSGEDDFAKLNFKKIYGNNFADYEDRKYRHAEILCPNEYNIDDSLNVILCRNHVEKSTFMTLLKAKNEKLFYKYKDKVKVCRSDMFEKNGLFVEDIIFNENSVTFNFTDTLDKCKYDKHQMEKRELDELSQIELEFVFQWLNGKNEILFERKLKCMMNYQDTRPIGINKIPHYEKTKILRISLYVEHNILACIEKPIDETNVI